VEVGVAHSTCGHVEQYLADLRYGISEVLDLEISVRGDKYGRTHLRLPSVRSGPWEAKVDRSGAVVLVGAEGLGDAKHDLGTAR
jgi:hypothetical protein